MQTGSEQRRLAALVKAQAAGDGAATTPRGGPAAPFDPPTAEREAYEWLRSGNGRPAPEMLYRLLESCAVPPSVMELTMRSLGVSHTPWPVPRGRIERSLEFSYARAVWHDAGEPAVPRPDEPPEDPEIDDPDAPRRPPSPRAPSTATDTEIARASFPRPSRGFGAQLARWRTWPAYLDAVDSLRALREGLDLARSMYRMQQDLDREADNRAAKTKFFIRLLRRHERRKRKNG